MARARAEVYITPMTTKKNRTDCHRPGAIVPTAYSFVMSYARPEPGIPMDPGLNMDLVRNLMDSVDWGRKSPVFGTIGKCGVCKASFNYGDLYRHENGDLVHMGHDCAAKYDMLANDPTWDARVESLKKGRAAYLKGIRNSGKRDKILATHPELAEAFTNGGHYIIADIKARFERDAQISDKQLALVLKLASEVKDKASKASADQARRDAEVKTAAPVQEGRQHVQGVVVSKKWYESDFGGVTKVVVKITTPAGVWLCFGSMPVPCERGDEVAFDARFKAGREPHFALYSRPTNGEVVKASNASLGGDQEVDGTCIGAGA